MTKRKDKYYNSNFSKPQKPEEKFVNHQHCAQPLLLSASAAAAASEPFFLASKTTIEEGTAAKKEGEVWQNIFSPP